MTILKLKYIFPILALLTIARVSFAQAAHDNGNLRGKATLNDYQTVVINQLFRQKMNLLYCPDIGGTPNINVDAVVERSQSVDIESGKIIFTWNEVGHLYFDEIKLSINLTSDKKSIENLNLEYFQYGKINIGSLQDPVLVDGFNFLGSCK